MLTFNMLLERAGIDPKTVRLLRHRDSKPRIHRALYDAAIAGDSKFAQYQERQGTPQVIEHFRAATHLAGFVVEPITQCTVFAGLWERLGQRDERKDNPFEPDPPTSKAVEFETKLIETFDDYRGRLVIDWGDGTRAWVQRADNQDKRIAELRRVRQEPEFPGFSAFQVPLDQIEALYAGWVQVLRNVRGVYLLVHRKKGDQYVGSAYGENGFYGRWLAYQDGHGGNVGMKELAAAASDYDVNILEVTASNATPEEIVARESLWKTKLGTRVVGLNKN